MNQMEDSSVQKIEISSLSTKNLKPMRRLSKSIVELYQKNNNKETFIEIYLCTLFCFTLFKLIYVVVNKQNHTTDLIIDLITLVVLLILFLLYKLTKIKKWNSFYSFLGLFISFGYFIQFFFIEMNQTRIEAHKFYFLLFSSHSSLCLTLEEKNFVLLLHWCLALVFDFVYIIIRNVKAKHFTFETIAALFFYILLMLAVKIALFTDYTNDSKKRWSKDAKKHFCNPTREIYQTLNMGYISCEGEKFEVIDYNDIIINKFLFLIPLINQMKSSYTVDVFHHSDLTYIDNFFHRKKTAGYKFAGANAFGAKAKRLFMSKRRFDIHNFYQKEKKSQKRKNIIKKYLSELVLKQVDFLNRISKKESFIDLGLFKYKRKSMFFYFNVFLRITIGKPNIYEFVLLEIPAEKTSKTIIDNYENSLKKISHEIKTPSMNIQKIIENILIQNGIYSDAPQGNNTVLIKIDQLTAIKYLSEICLLTVRDIVEHASLLHLGKFVHSTYHSTLNLPTIKSSSLSLEKFINYVTQLSKTYLYMLNKDCDIIMKVQERVKQFNIIIDEQKLFQIVSNLITNAIKNSPERKSIVLILSFIESRDLWYNDVIKTSHIRNNETAKDDNSECRSSQCRRNESDSFLLGVRLTIEDKGKGIDIKTMKVINDKKIHEVNECRDYSESKGIGSGIKISKKLCEEIGINIKCELITNKKICDYKRNNKDGEVLGTRIILDIMGEILLPPEYDRESLKTAYIDVSNLNIHPNEKLLVPYNDDFAEHKFRKKSKKMVSIVRKKRKSNTIINTSNTMNFFFSDSRSVESTKYVSHPLSSKKVNNTPKKSNFVPITEPLKKYINEFNSTKHSSFYRKSMISNSPSRKVSKNCVGSLLGPKRKISSSLCVFNETLISKPQLNFPLHCLNNLPKQVEVSQTGVGSLNNVAELTMDLCSSSNTDDQELTVLLVDDDSNITDSIKRIILGYSSKNDYSCKIKILSDGIELLYELYQHQKKNYQSNVLILCDEMMNYINGSEAYRLIMKYLEDILKRVLFISISAFSDESHKKRLDSLGIKYIYEKPITRGNIEYIFNKIVKEKFKVCE